MLGSDYAGGHAPAPAEMARYAILVIARTVLATECGHVTSAHPMAVAGESWIGEVAALLADRVRIYAPTADEHALTEAIDTGLVLLGGSFAEAG